MAGKRCLKRLSIILTVVLLVLNCACVGSYAADDDIVSETIDGMTWTINKTTGLMTVEGSGSFEFGCSSSETPYYDWFDYIQELVIGEGITYLGESAFDGCVNLKKVTLPDSMNSVAWAAFAGCSSLTDVDLGNGIKTIEDMAFGGCTSLKNIDIPPSVTTISGGAFSETGFETFTIPDTVTNLYAYGLFYDCKFLKSVNLPSNVTEINSCMFYGCTALEEITIPATVSLIGEEAFYGCTALKKVTVNGDLSEIGNYAFSGCSTLHTIEFRGKVTAIGECAFQKCTDLENMVLPQGLEVIGERSLGGCPKAFESLVIPSSVKSVGEYAFVGCYSLKSVVIEADLKVINQGTFKSCSNLSSITFPDSVTSIGSYAFEGCESLTEINLPSSLTFISSGAFWCCNGITRVDIPDGVVTIGRYAFSDCSSLTDITLPDSVEYIYETAFKNTPFYSNSANWDNGVLYIGNHLIIAKTSLSGNYEIRPGTKSIACYAFSGCKSLSSVTIPESVRGFGNYCFDYSVETIKYDAVDATSRATSTGDFRLKVGTNVIFGDKVEKIPAYTCYDSDKLQSVYMPKSLKAIGNYAFSNITPGFTVYYAGSQEEWNKINLGTGNTKSMNSIVYNHSHSYDTVTVESATQTATEYKHTCICGDFILETIPVCGFYTENGIKVDYDNKIIYGLSAGIRSLDSCTDFIDSSYTWAYSNIDAGFGTGTVAIILDETSIIDKYTILIYGDVDGNGWYDANDAFIVNMLASGLISKDALTDVQLAAADCNHDGEINNLDFNLLIDASVLKNKINQLPENVALENNSMYIEYASLINQSVSLETSTSETDSAQDQPNDADPTVDTEMFLINVFDFIRQIVMFIFSLFN